jgi:SAM-dependent methyltransferase
VADDTSRTGAGQGLPYVPLPAGLRDPRRQARAVFDGIAEHYDAARPGYPAEAIGDLVERCDIGPASHVLEVGCGTGQATRDLARTGAAIHCVERGADLAKLARRNLAAAANVSITTTTFEALAEAPGQYDAIVSATAFHWIDPRVSFAKAFRLLRPGGSLGLLTNAHGAGGTHAQQPLADAIRDLHRRFAPEVGSWTFPSADDLRARSEAGGDIAQVWARLERKLADPPSVSGLFDPPVVSVYPWLATYDRPGYLAMLATHSSYALLEPGRRRRLLDGIGDLIDQQLGGTVTKQYVTVLATAKRRSSRH